MNTKHSFRPWPEWPYRGLNYYRPQDQALLAGRDRDTVECSKLLAHPETRVLLLHGTSGCGKSSFMRARLIPSMEGEGAGYLFLKTPDADDEALFIRCTDTPMDQIARQVFLFAKMPFPLREPTGNQEEVDLTDALLGKDTWEGYLATASEEGDVVLESLKCIARKIPKTLVLIVDQAEEVVTLNVREDGLSNRARFFRFLRNFQILGFDARIIVALRTEFYGRFIDALHVDKRAAAFQQFFLSDLPRTALIEATVRPTRREALGSFGAPYDVYQFSFEPGLPEKIVDQILAEQYSRPTLQILQIVCLGLYEKVKANIPSVITHTEYFAAGEIYGLIVDHIWSAIRSAYGSQSEFDTDIHIIWKFLKSFYTIQEDGTALALTRSAQGVTDELEAMRLGIAPRALLECLTSTKTMILRALRAVKPDGQIIDEVTLAHDSVALALETWRKREKLQTVSTGVHPKEERRIITAAELIRKEQPETREGGALEHHANVIVNSPSPYEQENSGVDLFKMVVENICKHKISYSYVFEASNNNINAMARLISLFIERATLVEQYGPGQTGDLQEELGQVTSAMTAHLAIYFVPEQFSFGLQYCIHNAMSRSAAVCYLRKPGDTSWIEWCTHDEAVDIARGILRMYMKSPCGDGVFKQTVYFPLYSTEHSKFLEILWSKLEDHVKRICPLFYGQLEQLKKVAKACFDDNWSPWPSGCDGESDVCREQLGSDGEIG